MKKFNKFDVILNLWISLIINVALSIILPLIAMHTVTWPIFLKGFAIAFPVSTLFVMLLPIVALGNKFAVACKTKPGSPLFTILSTLILALLMGTFMSLLMTAVNAGVGPHFIGAWLSCDPLALLTVYLSALLGIWTGLPLTMRLVGPPPNHETPAE